MFIASCKKHNAVWGVAPQRQELFLIFQVLHKHATEKRMDGVRMDGVLSKLSQYLEPERSVTEEPVLCDFATSDVFSTSWEAACAREAKNGVYSKMRDTLLPENKLVQWVWVEGPFYGHFTVQ